MLLKVLALCAQSARKVIRKDRNTRIGSYNIVLQMCTLFKRAELVLILLNSPVALALLLLVTSDAIVCILYSLSLAFELLTQADAICVLLFQPVTSLLCLAL